MAIGDHIRTYRIQAGCSQASLAEKVGVSQNTISSWETGRTEPSRSDTRKIAQALSVDISLLELGDEAAEIAAALGGLRRACETDRQQNREKPEKHAGL